MDTSTPLKQLCSKQVGSSHTQSNESNADYSVQYNTKHRTNRVFPIEQSICGRLYSDSKSTDANTSVDVFPVSPICCMKNAPPSDVVLDLPYLDSSNLKWSSSLHTSYAEDEAIEMEMEMETIDQRAADENGTSVDLNRVENELFVAQKNTVSDTLYSPNSPIFVADGDSICGARKSFSDMLGGRASHDARAKPVLRICCLNENAFELDDSYCDAFGVCTRQTPTPFKSTTSKMSRYSLDSRHENSKKFVYPLASVSIKKPQSCLNVDQLTNCALSLEAVAKSRAVETETETKVSANQFAKNTMVAFNELYDGSGADADADAEAVAVSVNNRFQRASPYKYRKDVDDAAKCGNADDRAHANVVRTLADIMFARKNNDRETIRARFEKMMDRLADGDRIGARLARSLYSAYYFVTRVHLAGYNTDAIYRRDVTRHFVRRMWSSFKFAVPFDRARNIFDRIENDIYTLERTGIPVATLYVNHSKALRFLRTGAGDDGSDAIMRTTNVGSQPRRSERLPVNESATDEIPGTNYVSVPTGERISNYKVGSIPFCGFRTASGRRVSVPEKTVSRSVNKYGDIFSGQRNNDVLHMDKKRRRVGNGGGSAFDTAFESYTKPSPTCKPIFPDIIANSNEDRESATWGFKTGSGRTIKVDDRSLRICENLFSDISADARSNLGGDGDEENATYRNLNESRALGFKTGSGRTINVDDGSLRRSRHLFSDISADAHSNGDGDGDGENAYKKGDERRTLGFKTSSGRAINVDDESLRMSTRLFSDISVDEKRHETTTAAFRTTFGQTIDVDDRSPRTRGILCARDALDGAQTSIRIAAVASTFRTGSGNRVSVNVDSLEKSKHLLADVCVSPQNAAATYEWKEKIEREPSASASSPNVVQNSSFDLCREITESTSAFLYDISHEQSCTSLFAPNESTASTRSPADSRRNSDVKTGSRSSSPVFDAKYVPSKRKRSTRKSSGVQSLNITYVRKTNNVGGDDERHDTSSGHISAELETLKMNFSFKSFKRKSSSPDDSAVPVTAKKCRNDARMSPPSISGEQLAPSHCRATAAALQQRFVSNKPKEFCRPTRGYYSTLIYGDGDSDSENHAGRISLGRFARNENPQLRTFDEYVKFGLLPVVIRMNSQNARHFTFTSHFISDEQLKSGATGAVLFGDAVPVILNEKNQVTLEEVVRGFFASPGVDPKLISREWVANHYRWIVWKLASTERFFPKSLGRRYLTLDNVLFQLKFKYEQEVDRCVRSALKRILEGDDSPAKPLILCVASVTEEAHSSNDYKIELTDGWYSIFAQTNDQLNDLITRKKVLVGSKLIITGAELVGLREPCDPLQANENARLKFSVNSCRRVRWDTRLGFHKGNLSPTNRIQTILPKGGFITHLTAVVARVYPLLFLEKYDNAAADVAATGTGTGTGTATASATWSRLHNEKVEMKKTMAYEKDRQSCIESILSQVTNQVLRENAKTDADAFADGERLRDIIQQRVQSRLPTKFSKNRHVSRLLKLRLVDAQDMKNKASAILTIWNPCDDVTSFFKEERSYHFFNVNANYIRNGELQLCSTRSSKYDRDCAGGSDSGNGDSSCLWFRRRVRRVDDFNERCEDCEKFGSFDEVDVTGVIIRIQPKTRPQSADYEPNRRIYLADLQRRFFALSFRIDSKNFDYGDSIESGKIVAGLNLQWKNGWLCWKIPILYVSELSSFVQSTNIASLQQGIDQVRRHFQSNSLETFVTECQEKLNSIVDSSADDNACNVNVNRSGIGNVSSFNPTESSTESNFSVKNQLNNQTTTTTFKNADAKCKFEKLQNYGRPPALSPVVLTSQSKSKAKLPLPISKRCFKS